uniref:SWIM-type domain-containing protein n=1 Tax=Rhodosorus marinus TaxID=101924 RepID=A0A6T6M108_9RHOD|mmetsp:Transcript_1953/g.2961  ORF Transcript_1953/g.2961 Transcript_1953/m.2961 type:complete len:168 (+) Transcript_1953:361-864(+)
MVGKHLYVLFGVLLSFCLVAAAPLPGVREGVQSVLSRHQTTRLMAEVRKAVEVGDKEDIALLELLLPNSDPRFESLEDAEAHLMEFEQEIDEMEAEGVSLEVSARPGVPSNKFGDWIYDINRPCPCQQYFTNFMGYCCHQICEVTPNQFRCCQWPAFIRGCDYRQLG